CGRRPATAPGRAADRDVRLVLSVPRSGASLPTARLEIRGCGQEEPQLLSRWPAARPPQAGNLWPRGAAPGWLQQKRARKEASPGRTCGSLETSGTCEAGLQSPPARCRVGVPGHERNALVDVHSAVALLAAVGNRSVFQDVEAESGAGRLPSITV